MASILDTLIIERAQYGARLTPAEAYQLLNRTAIQHDGVGLLQKSGGNQFNGCAVDILFLKSDGRIYDVLIDAPDSLDNYSGTCQPAWQDKGLMDLARWVAPVGTAPAPEPPPLPEPPKPCPAEQKIAALTQLVNDYIKIVAEYQEAVLKLERHIDVLAADVKLLKQQPTREVDTSRNWGHAHRILL